MSRVSDMATAEADEVEAADEEAAEAKEFEAPEPEPEPEASSQVDAEKALGQIDRENDRHAKAIAKIMGEDFALLYPCQHCGIPAAGFTFDAPDDTPPLQHPDEYKRCDRCYGHGAVLTGAVNDIGRTQTCTKCSGKGFVEEPIMVAQPQYVTPAPVSNGSTDLANQLRAAGYMVIDPPATPPAA